MIEHSGMAVAYLSARDSRRKPGMYVFWNSPYNYRLFDRYACPIASLAVLDWMMRYRTDSHKS
jgi:hypothetical protein